MDHCTPSVVGVGHRKSPLICFISSKPGVDSNQTYQPLGRRGGSMVSVLDTGMSGLGSGPAMEIVLCSWARHFTLTVPLSTQVYKWVPAITLKWTSILSRGGSRKTSTHLMLLKLGLATGLMSHLHVACMQTYPPLPFQPLD